MSQSLLDHVAASAVKKEVPDLRPGQVVRVYQKIKEGEKERTQIFEGLVISLNAGSKADKTFTVRKVVEGVGVEKVFPLYSALIEKIEMVKQGKVRRSKLYYMRDLQGKSTRLQEQELDEEAKKFLKSNKKAAPAPVVAEEPAMEEAPTEAPAEPEVTETVAETPAEEPEITESEDQPAA